MGITLWVMAFQNDLSKVKFTAWLISSIIGIGRGFFALT